jgi:DNA-binding transcriptional regulator YhcF (GntR family)
MTSLTSHVKDASGRWTVLASQPYDDLMDDRYDFLGELDPEDSRQESQQIAIRLRAAILAGRFGPGERLPSQNDLAERYGVARETVKRALELLRRERLIVTRQGTGSFVRAQTQRPVELRPHIEAAFERPHVSIDFAGFSGETLRDAMTEPLDNVRAGRLAPESITIRLLVSDMTRPMALPARAETQSDDPMVRERAERITRRAIEGILDQARELSDLGLVPQVNVQARAHGIPPVFKMYLLNNDEVFFGFYPIVERTVSIKGQPVAIYDLLGKDVPLFHYATDAEDERDTQYVDAARQWFESVWSTVAHDWEA